MLVVMDDKIQPQENLEGLNQLSGEYITNVSYLTKKAAIEKYGDKGTNGAILITTTFFK